jgi:hypothetical protein
MNEVWRKPPISLADYQAMVSREIGVSSWHLVDQKRIDIFAEVIEDRQFIHVDSRRAKAETSFGATIAHGFLTMSLMSVMSYEVMPVISGTTMSVNYGFDKLRSFRRCGRDHGCVGGLCWPTRNCARQRNCNRVPMSPSRSRAGEARFGGRLDRLDLF